MAFASVSILLIISVFLMVIPAGVLLQILLSTRKSKWFGIILPVLSFLMSIVYVLNISGTSVNGRAFWSGGFGVIVVFIMGNVPTIVLSIIYMACREKVKKNKEINKMNIHDLE